MIEEEIVRHAFPSSLESYGNDPKFVPFSYSIVHLWKLTGGGGLAHASGHEVERL